MVDPILVLPYLILWATLVQALLVGANVLPPSCARCGLRVERRHLGESICSCHGQRADRTAG